MPETYTIDAPIALKKNLPASGKYSAKAIYTMTLVDANQEPTLGVEVMQNLDTPEPKVGDTVEGELSQGQYGWTFKKNFDGQRRPLPSSSEGQRHLDSREASIVRQHSQHMAIMWAVVIQKAVQERAARDPHTETAEPLTPPLNPNLPWLKGLIDWFDRDAKGEQQP